LRGSAVKPERKKRGALREGGKESTEEKGKTRFNVLKLMLRKKKPRRHKLEGGEGRKPTLLRQRIINKPRLLESGKNGLGVGGGEGKTWGGPK